MKLGSGLHMENTATVVEQVQTLSDLVTVKYVLEKVVILEDVKWYGENRVLLLAHGVVKAGIDLKRITPDDVTITGKTISLRLPPPQIMDAYLDDKNSQVIDHATGLLRAFDKDLEQTARANAVNDIRRAARADGILDEADKRARLGLKLCLRQAGFEQVEFRSDKNPARGTALKLDSVDDFNRAGNFSAHLNLNGNLHPALGRRNFQCLQEVGLHQISRHLRCKPTVGDFGLPANLLREFQRIHFSSHETFCRNSCARKIWFPPCFY